MATLTGLVSFTAGTPAVASQVNTNFTAVKNFVESITAGTNIDAGAISFVKLATDVTNRLVPVGTVHPFVGATAPTGWLLCDGATSTAGYPLLAAMVGATTPDMRGRFLLGKTASGTGSTLLGTGGSSTITASNMPSHQHTAGTLSAVAVGDHQHSESTISLGFTGQQGFTDYLVNAVSGTNTGAAGAHGHSITGSTASAGSGSEYFQPFIAVNYIVKHD